MTEPSVSNVEHSARLNTGAQMERIHSAWELFPPDNIQLFELRAIDPLSAMHPQVKHFRADKYDCLASLQGAIENRALELNRAGYNIYTTLNPVKPDFRGSAAKDADILHRSLLLIDIDRVGNTKQPATDNEVSKALTHAEAISAFLAENEWPDPVVMMSGNGVHLYYGLPDLPNTEQSTALVKGVLQTLSQNFDSEEFEVDKSVFNASRITKVPGTVARKGTASEERPYRMARLLSHGELGVLRVTEDMLAQIAGMNAPDEINLAPPPREPAAPIESDPVTSKQLKSILASISSDVPRGNGSIDLDKCTDYWLGVIWAVAGSDLPDAMLIAQDWSKQSPRYTDAGFAMAWNSYDPNHPSPIGIASVRKLAKAIEGQKREPTFVEKLKGWSSTGDSEAMAKQMLEDKFVLPDLAILGQWTTIYASHNVGKTLVTIRLLKDSVESGELDGRTIFYVNADDNYRGSVEQLSIVEQLGIEMLVPYRNNFDPNALVPAMWDAVKKNEARNIVIVLDTLKKFVNLMDKTEGTKFGKVARQFTQAGGTLIGLAHTNKHRDDEGKSVYSGTTDVADDCDCVYVIDLIDDDRASGKRTIQFRNEKLRGDVAIEKTFTYLRQDGSTYADLLDTLSVVDEETAKHEKELLRKKRQYYADKLVIDTIMDLAKIESLALTELIAQVSEETGKPKSKCKAIVERYKGDGLNEFTYWRLDKGAHNSKTLKLLTLGV